MRINNLELNTDIYQILDKLFLELKSKGSPLFSKGYKESGDYLMVQCPYHKFGLEHNPSAQFRKSDGLFYCFNCKEPHSLPDVIYKCLGVNGRSWLLENFDGSDIDRRKINLGIKKPEKPKIEYVDKEILKKYRYFHPYMFERKLTEEVIRKFDVGYDKENDRITFPNKDENGNILFIATRNIKNKFFHYPKDVDKPLYGLYELQREVKNGVEINEIYVCESMIDILTIWSWGKYGVAMNGTGSSKQFEQLSKCNYRSLILATDNDEAGRKSREKIRKNVKGKLIREIDYSSYGNCKDINDMSKEQFLNAKIKFM